MNNVHNRSSAGIGSAVVSCFISCICIIICVPVTECP